MVKELDDLNVAYQGVIDTLLTQKAAFESKFKERLTEIYNEIENSENIKHLRIADKIRIYNDWVIQMMLNNTHVIKQQQEYIRSILESIDTQETETEDYETRIEELTEMAETLRNQRDSERQELAKLKTKMELKEQDKAAQKEKGEVKNRKSPQPEIQGERKVCSSCLSVKSVNDFALQPNGVDRRKTCLVCRDKVRRWEERKRTDAALAMASKKSGEVESDS